MRYVAVSNDQNDKVIKDGPLELDNPSEHTPEEGTHLMPEDAALTAGYSYAAGGGAGFAADGTADQGVQGDGGGQGAQTQPGGRGNPHQ
ncbi:hypothetical protein [Streptomyces sp. NPDC057002]|uniref:hypothetical protein n=1 Tax=Streptomyces sp. NPDC057002 TaxID=3345992 RepID=UPI0036433F11